MDPRSIINKIILERTEIHIYHLKMFNLTYKIIFYFFPTSKRKFLSKHT